MRILFLGFIILKVVRIVSVFIPIRNKWGLNPKESWIASCRASLAMTRLVEKLSDRTPLVTRGSSAYRKDDKQTLGCKLVSALNYNFRNKPCRGVSADK